MKVKQSTGAIVSELGSELMPASLIDPKQLLTLMEKSVIPGMSVAVISKGEFSQFISLGIADKSTNAAVTSDTVFEAASLSKPVFAYLILRLVEKGVLSLDQKFSDLLPPEQLDEIFAYKQFALAGDERAKSLTARMVLSHQSGLQNNIPGFGSDPGEFHYSGTGYSLLQKIIERKTGKSLETLAREEVFAPLGMEHSHFVLSDEASLTLARGHNGVGVPQPKIIPTEAHAQSTLHTTAVDYSRLIAALVTDIFPPEKHVAAAIVEEALSSSVTLAGKPISWGLGWGLQKTDQGTIAFHWGDDGSFKAFVAINLETHSAIVYFTNSQNGLDIFPELVMPMVGDMRPAFAWLSSDYGYESYHTEAWEMRHQAQLVESQGRCKEAVESYQRAAASINPKAKEEIQERIKWLSYLMQFNPENKPVAIDDIILQRYAGEYGNQLMTVERGQLMLRVDQLCCRLIPVAEGVFFLDHPNRSVCLRFGLDSRGIMSLTTDFSGVHQFTTLRSREQVMPLTKSDDGDKGEFIP